MSSRWLFLVLFILSTEASSLDLEISKALFKVTQQVLITDQDEDDFDIFYPESKSMTLKAKSFELLPSGTVNGNTIVPMMQASTKNISTINFILKDESFMNNSQQFTDDDSMQNDSPYIKRPMHPFIPKTGSTDREEIYIKNIKEYVLDIHLLSKPRLWKYAHFNNDDFLLAQQLYHLMLWKFNDRMSFREPLCTINTSKEGIITHSTFYVTTYSLQVIFILQLTHSVKLKTYDITSKKCIEDNAQNLPFYTPIDLGVINNEHHGSIILLYDSYKVLPSSYGYKSHSPIIEHVYSNERHLKYINIFVSNAIDFESFIINGFAFAAVAHGSTCDIYRFDEFLDKYIHYYSLSVQGIINIHAFRLGFDHYLGMSTNTRYQYLLAYREGSFYLKQIFPISSVLQWSSMQVENCRHDIFLIFIRNDRTTPLVIYKWNGAKRIFESENHIKYYIEHNFDPLPFSLASFAYQETVFLVEFDLYGVAHLLTFETFLKPLPDKFLLEYEKINELLRLISTQLLSQKNEILKQRYFIQNSLRISESKKTIKAAQNIYQIFSSIVNIEDITNLRKVTWEKSRLTLNDMKYKVSDLKNEMIGLKREIQFIKKRFNNVVFLNKPQHFPFRIRFESTCKINHMDASKVLIRNILNTPISKFLSTLVLKNSTALIKGTKYFYSSSFHTIKGPIIGISEIVSRKGPIFIFSPLSINRLQVNTFNSKYGLSNLNLNSVISLTGGIYNITSIKGNYIKIMSLSAQVFNGIHLPSLRSKALFHYGNQNGDSLSFYSQTKYNGKNIMRAGILKARYVYARKLNDLGISLMKSFVLTDIPIKLGTVWFSSIFTNNILVSTLNGLVIPRDLFTTFSSQNIYGHLFCRESVFNHLKVDSLNGQLFPQNFVTLSGRDNIDASIEFRSGFQAKKIHMAHSSKVDKFDLSDIWWRFVNKLIKQRNISVENLEVRYLNKVNLNFLFGNAIVRNKMNRTIRLIGHKDFSNIAVNELYIQTINNVRLTDLASTISNKFIESRLMIDNVTVDNLFVQRGYIGDVNLVNLITKRISLMHESKLYGNRYFDEVEIYSLQGPLLNKIRSNEFVTRKTNKTLKNMIIEGSLMIPGSISTSKIFIKGKLSNTPLHLLSRRIPINKIGIYKANLSASSGVFYINKLNDKKFAGIVSNIMYKSKKQKSRQRLFRKITFFKGTSNRINGHSMRWLKDSVIKLDGSNQVIKYPISFTKTLKCRNISINYIQLYGVKPIHYSSFLSNLWTIGNSDQLQIFNKGIYAKNLIIRRINGTDFYHKLLLKNIRQNITVPISVNAISAPNINIRGLFNKENWQLLWSDIVFWDRPNYIRGKLIIPYVNTSQILTRGYVNGVDFQSLLSNLLLVTGNQIIDDTKVFGRSKFLNGLKVKMINKINLDQFLKDAVWLNRKMINMTLGYSVPYNYIQIIHKPVTINGFFTVGKRLGASTIFANLINRFNITDMAKHIIRIDKPIIFKGSVTFLKDVYINNLSINGKVNDIDLLRDVLWLKSPFENYIQVMAFKNIKWAYIKSLKFGRVNNYDLKLLTLDSLNKFTKQYISGTKKANKIFAMKLRVGRINNIKVEDYLTKNINGLKLDGNWTFLNTLRVGSLVSPIIGGVNISDLIIKSMYKDVLQNINTPMIIQHAVFSKIITDHKDSHQNNLINGFNVPELVQKIKGLEGRHSVILDLIRKNLSSSFNHTNNLLHWAGEDISLEGLEMFQEIASGSFVEVIGKDILIGMKNSRDKREYSKMDDLNSKIESNIFSQDDTTDDTFIHYIKSKDSWRIRENIYDQRSFSRKLNDSISSSNSYKKDFRHTYSSLLTSNNNRFKVLRYVFNDGDFKLANYSKASFRRMLPFSIEGQEYIIYQLDDNGISVIVGKRRHFLLGMYVSAIDIIKLSKKTVIIGVLCGLNGTVDIWIGKHHNFILIKTIDVGYGATSLSLFIMDKELNVAVARVSLCDDSFHGSVVYSLYDDINDYKQKWVQSSLLTQAEGVTSYKYNGQYYLVFWSEKFIKIYKNTLNRCQWTIVDTKEMREIRSLKMFEFGSQSKNLLIMAAVSRTSLKLWTYKGISGFSESLSARSISGEDVGYVKIRGNLYIIVAQSSECNGSIVYKAIFRKNILI